MARIWKSHHQFMRDTYGQQAQVRVCACQWIVWTAWGIPVAAVALQASLNRSNYGQLL